MKILPAALLPMVLAATVPLLAQQKPVAEAFTADANDVFTALVGQAKSGFLFPRGADGVVNLQMEPLSLGLIRRQHLVQENQWPLGWGGTWSGQNETGSVTATIQVPDILDKTHDHALVIFRPERENTIPQAILTHLISKTEKSEVRGGNALELPLPWETTTPNGRCRAQTTLTVRIDGGTLLENSVRVFCDVPKPTR